MKGYKAFDADMKCRGKQYEVGKTYEEAEAKLCKAGMHFCEKPFDVLDFYPVVGDDLRLSRFAEVEAEEPKADSDKKKYVTKKLTVGAELGIAGLVKAHVAFVKESVKECDDLAKGSSGAGAQIGSSGDWAQIGSSGDGAKIGSSGYGAQIKCNGKNSVIACAGPESIVKGPIGMWFCLSEYGNDADGNYICIGMKAAQIDGTTLKADTWYTLKDGEFVEVPDAKN